MGGDFLEEKKIHLGKFAKQRWKRLAFALFCMVMTVTLNMYYPKLTEKIIDDVIGRGNMAILPKLLVMILFIGVGRAFFNYYEEYTFDCVGCGVGSDLRKDLFRHIQGLSMDYFDKTSTGELMARVKDDVDRIWDAFGMVGMLTLEVILHVTMVLWCMFHISVKLTLIPLAVMLVLGVLATIMEKKLDKLYEDISETNAEMTTVAEENLAGVRTVKAFARERHEIEKFRRKNEEYRALNIKQTKVLVRYYPYFQFVGSLLPVMMTILGGYYVAKGQLTLGAMVAFVQYCRGIVWPMEVLGEMTNEISSIAASYKKINKIYAQSATVKEPENPVTLETVKGDITFDHVTFRRESQDILQGRQFPRGAGADRGHHGRHRLRQEQRAESAGAVLRRVGGLREAGRRGCAAAVAPSAAGQHLHGDAGRVPVLRHHSGEHPHGREEVAGTQRHPRRGGAGAGQRLYREHGGAVRHRDRRAGRGSVRRTEAAHQHRPVAGAKLPDSGAGRFHLRAGHGDGI
jgi:ATP-binding cassette subfamily B multidrug efflux pump